MNAFSFSNLSLTYRSSFSSSLPTWVMSPLTLPPLPSSISQPSSNLFQNIQNYMPQVPSYRNFSIGFDVTLPSASLISKQNTDNHARHSLELLSRSPELNPPISRPLYTGIEKLFLSNPSYTKMLFSTDRLPLSPTFHVEMLFKTTPWMQQPFLFRPESISVKLIEKNVQSLGNELTRPSSSQIRPQPAQSLALAPQHHSFVYQVLQTIGQQMIPARPIKSKCSFTISGPCNTSSIYTKHSIVP